MSIRLIAYSPRRVQRGGVGVTCTARVRRSPQKEQLPDTRCFEESQEGRSCLQEHVWPYGLHGTCWLCATGVRVQYSTAHPMLPYSPVQRQRHLMALEKDPRHPGPCSQSCPTSGTANQRRRLHALGEKMRTRA
jgi:hypothetical protein